MDADDAMAADRVEQMVIEAQARKLDALADNQELIDGPSGQRIGVALDPELMATSNLISLDALLGADWPGRNLAYRSLGLAKPILRRAFLEEHGLRYDTSVRLGEDLLFYSALACRGSSLRGDAGNPISISYQRQLDLAPPCAYDRAGGCERQNPRVVPRGGSEATLPAPDSA